MAPAAKYENILKSISSGIIALDADGKIDYFNSRALKMLELSRDTVLNFDIHHLFPDLAKLINEFTHGWAFQRSVPLGTVEVSYQAHQEALSPVAQVKGAVAVTVLLKTSRRVPDAVMMAMPPL